MKQVRNAACQWGWAILITVVLATAGTGRTQAAQAQGQKTGVPAKAEESAKKNPVDVNSADAKALETLPGIGPALATKIIAGRPYQNLADLGKVKGLSQSKLDALKGSVTFGPSGTAPNETSKKTAKKQKPAQSVHTAETKTPATSASTAAGQPEARTTQAAPSPTGRAAGNFAPGEKININTATAEELDRLPGIGPVRAQAILDYRNQSGGFKTIEDIEKVKGIKAGEFSKIKDHIKVTD